MNLFTIPQILYCQLYSDQILQILNRRTTADQGPVGVESKKKHQGKWGLISLHTDSLINFLYPSRFSINPFNEHFISNQEHSQIIQINHPLFKIRAPPFYMYPFQTLSNPKWQDGWLEVLVDFLAQSYYSANKPSNPYKHFRRNSVVLHTRQAQVSIPSDRYFTDTIKSSKNIATVPLDSIPEENPETTWHLWVMAYMKPVRSTANSLRKELIKFLERDSSASVSI